MLSLTNNTTDNGTVIEFESDFENCLTIEQATDYFTDNKRGFTDNGTDKKKIKGILKYASEKNLIKSKQKDNSPKSPKFMKIKDLEEYLKEKITNRLGNDKQPTSNRQVENELKTLQEYNATLIAQLLVADKQNEKLLVLLENQQQLTLLATQQTNLIQKEKNSLVLRLNDQEKFNWTWKFWLWFRKPSKSD